MLANLYHRINGNVHWSKLRGDFYRLIYTSTS